MSSLSRTQSANWELFPARRQSVEDHTVCFRALYGTEQNSLGKLLSIECHYVEALSFLHLSQGLYRSQALALYSFIHPFCFPLLPPSFFPCCLSRPLISPPPQRLSSLLWLRIAAFIFQDSVFPPLFAFCVWCIHCYWRTLDWLTWIGLLFQCVYIYTVYTVYIWQLPSVKPFCPNSHQGFAFCRFKRGQL